MIIENQFTTGNTRVQFDELVRKTIVDIERRMDRFLNEEYRAMRKEIEQLLEQITDLKTPLHQSGGAENSASSLLFSNSGKPRVFHDISIQNYSTMQWVRRLDGVIARQY